MTLVLHLFAFTLLEGSGSMFQLGLLARATHPLVKVSSRVMSTATSALSWAEGLGTKDLKLLAKPQPSEGQAAIVERSDLVNFVESKYDSLNEAESTLSILRRAQDILSQDRGVLNFEHYVPSPNHIKRMSELKKTAPELYDNPSITPRSKWFSHPRYHSNAQMPPFHVHFREEMQYVINEVYEAVVLVSSAKRMNRRKQLGKIQSALSDFQSCMRGLNGHVSIEEYACFPLYEREFPTVDIKFLYTDHKDLHRDEESVTRALQNALRKDHEDNLAPSREMIGLLQTVVDFDAHLMAHLGEEEELVVPLSLTEKRIMF